jgi:hypothetical protein
MKIELLLYGSIFLKKVDTWILGHYQWIYAIADNLSSHRSTHVLLISLAHQSWRFVFQPKYAAYLNLLQPWCKVLRSLTLKGRLFQSWGGSCAAIAAL